MIKTQGPTAFIRIVEAVLEGVREGKVSLNAHYELTTGSGRISANTEDGKDALLDEFGNTTDEDTTPAETPSAKAALTDPPEHKEDPVLTVDHLRHRP